MAAPDKNSIDIAIAKIKAIVAQPEEGEVYTGRISSIMDFGAFVEFMPGRDGLLHISEISWDRVESMEQTGMKEGDEVTVKLIEIDKKTGKFRLSMKALQPKPDGYVERAPRPRRDNNERGGGNGNNRNGGGNQRHGGGNFRGPRRDNNRNND